MDVLTVPGDHHSVFQAPNLEPLARALASVLSKAGADANDTETPRRVG
ncbi:hypothetical protein ACLESO_33530 [Pyxidicoccus sp. 3LG]